MIICAVCRPILIMGICLFLLSVLHGSSAATITVGQSGCNFTTIQEAIDSSITGDLIIVQRDTYFENLVVDRSISLVGLERPEVNGMGRGSPIIIAADGVLLEGFYATNSTYPLPVIKVASNNNTLTKNSVSGGWYGILLLSAHNLVSENAVFDNDDGIRLINADNNTLLNNEVYDNEDGIIVDFSHGNMIEKNLVNNNSDDGIICMNHSRDNLVRENRVNECGWHGLELFYASNNSITDNFCLHSKACNVLFRGTQYSLLANNTLEGSGMEGIDLLYSDENLILNNTIENNHRTGILFESSGRNTLIHNNVLKSGVYGFYLEASSNDNLIYENCILKSGNFSVYDNGKNRWDNGTIGNSYDDCDESSEGCKDLDKNGICDSRYRSRGGKSIDNYPLTSCQGKFIGFNHGQLQVLLSEL
jgi:nitrous oxidase accessory protein